MLRLDDGESGELTQPLTTQNLAYQGAPNAATSAPAYNGLLPGGRVVHGTDGVVTLGSTDNLSLALAKIGYLHTCKYGDTFAGAMIFGAGSSLTVNDNIVAAFNMHDGVAPFTVLSTTLVANLHAAVADYAASAGNADTVDSAHAVADADPAAEGQLIKTDASGFTTTPHAAPGSDYEVANKKYVDDIAGVSHGLRYVNVGTANWTVPAGVTNITLCIIGGGGGGGGSGIGDGSSSGGGGGSAAPTWCDLSVVAGDIINCTAGAGGAGGVGANGGGATNGSNGGDSWVRVNGGPIVYSSTGGTGGYSGEDATHPCKGGTYGGGAGGEQDDGGGGSQGGGSGGGWCGGYGGGIGSDVNGGPGHDGSGGGGGGNTGGSGGSGGDGYVHIFY